MERYRGERCCLYCWFGIIYEVLAIFPYIRKKSGKLRSLQNRSKLLSKSLILLILGFANNCIVNAELDLTTS